MNHTRVWRLRSRDLALDEPRVMGILNVTPDSFSDGGLWVDRDRAVDHAARMVSDGAAIIDVGGESTRPGAEPVSVEEELARVIPVVEALCVAGVPVSIDTMKPEVAAAAVAAGAEVVNDVSGFGDPEMRRVVAETGAGVVIMHMQGEPRTMQQSPSYDDVVTEVADHLASRAAACVDAGVAPESVVVDPGIGFGKTLDHNLELLAGLEEITGGRHPVMIGASRKSFLGKILDIGEAADRDAASAIVTALAVERGVSVVRVHDVAASARAARLAWAIVSAHQGGRLT